MHVRGARSERIEIPCLNFNQGISILSDRASKAINRLATSCRLALFSLSRHHLTINQSSTNSFPKIRIVLQHSPLITVCRL